MNGSQISVKGLSVSVLALLLIGAYIGYLIMDILMAVASPRFSTDSFLMSQTMATLYGPLLNKETMGADMVSKHPVAFLVSHALLLVALYVYWLTRAFDKLNRLWEHNKITVSLVAIVVLILQLLLLSGYLFGMEKLFNIDVPHRVSPSSWGMYFLFALLVFWVLSLGSELMGKDGSQKSIDHKKVLGHAFAASILSIVVQYSLINAFDGFMVSLTVLWGPGEGTLEGWQTIYLIMISFCALIYAFTGSLIIYILKPKPLRNIMAPLIVMAIALLAGQTLTNYLNNTLDMRYTSLNEAAGLNILDTPPPAKRFLLLNDNAGNDTNSTVIVEWNRRVDKLVYADDLNESVDLVEANVENLKKYIQKDVHTHYSNVAVDALKEIKKIDLDIDGYREVSLESMYKGGTFMNAILLTLTLNNNIPVTENNLRFIQALSNEDDFYIAGDNAYLLARLWISFEDEKKAKYFYDRATATSTSRFRWYDSWDELLQQYRFNKGRISGKVSGLDQPTQVVLVDCKTPDKQATLSFYKIKAVATTSDTGEFSFENLVKGEYTLAVVIPDSKQIINKPEEVVHISISEERPEVDDLSIVIE